MQRALSSGGGRPVKRPVQRAILLACLCALAGYGLLSRIDRADGEDKPAAPQSPAPEAVTWQNDPVCRLVFFAVLEGLYEDGVPDEAINLIVPPKTDLDSNVKHSFVFNCDLCHATYEAFVLYQRRQAFANTSGKTTFGKGIDPKVLERLRADDVFTRIHAMGDLVTSWVNRRIELMRLSDEEKRQLLDKLLEYAAKGNERFKEYRADRKSVYFEWQFYDGCQACKAAENIAGQFQNQQKK